MMAGAREPGGREETPARGASGQTARRSVPRGKRGCGRAGRRAAAPARACICNCVSPRWRGGSLERAGSRTSAGGHVTAAFLRGWRRPKPAEAAAGSVRAALPSPSACPGSFCPSPPVCPAPLPRARRWARPSWLGAGSQRVALSCARGALGFTQDASFLFLQF